MCVQLQQNITLVHFAVLVNGNQRKGNESAFLSEVITEVFYLTRRKKLIYCSRACTYEKRVCELSRLHTSALVNSFLTTNNITMQRSK